MLAGLSTHGADEGLASGSALLLESSLELLELLELEESEPGSAGGASEGNGCSCSAEVFDVDGAGASGELSDGTALAGSPGKGNCSAGDGCLLSAGGVQGLSWVDLEELWLAGGQG